MTNVKFSLPKLSVSSAIDKKSDWVNFKMQDGSVVIGMVQVFTTDIDAPHFTAKKGDRFFIVDGFYIDGVVSWEYITE